MPLPVPLVDDVDEVRVESIGFEREHFREGAPLGSHCSAAIPSNFSGSDGLGLRQHVAERNAEEATIGLVEDRREHNALLCDGGNQLLHLPNAGLRFGDSLYAQWSKRGRSMIITR